MPNNKINKLTILFSHGSKDPQWKAEMEALSAPAKHISGDVLTAYMELCSPSLEEIIVEKGADNIDHINLLPVFLATGKHLKYDIPSQVAALTEKYGIPIDILPPIGHHPLLAKAIADITLEQVSSR